MVSVQHNADGILKGIRRAALITSLVLGALPVLLYLGLTLHRGIVHYFGYLRPITPGEYATEIIQGLAPGLLLGGPLLIIGAFSWRWPLIGGMVLLLLSIPLIYAPLASYDMADYGALIGVVYLAVGLMYLFAWWRGRHRPA